MKKFLVVASIVLLVGSVHATTRYVAASNPSPVWPYTNGWASAATNIQDAVDACVDTDLVLISNGVYLLSSQILITNSITLGSIDDDPASVLIDGDDTTRCFQLNADATVSGLTISNGHQSAENGGAAYLNMAGILTNCLIVGNRADWNGGGVLLNTGGSIVDCTVRDNWAALSGGGVAFLWGGAVQESLICSNMASWNGGGAYCCEGGWIVGCTLAGNYASSDGGGAYFERGGMIQLGTIVYDNTACSNGGGVYMLESGDVNDTALIRNKALGSDGGGVFCMHGGIVTNCLLDSNSANLNGGGVYVDSTGVVERCVITGNSAIRGGGVQTYSGDGAVVATCTITNNGAQFSGGVDCVGGTVRNCLIACNSALYFGGGFGSAGIGNLINCTVCSNSATYVGGIFAEAAYSSDMTVAVHNTINYLNTPDNYTNIHDMGDLGVIAYKYSCTYPTLAPTDDGGFNTTNDPLWVDVANDDFRLTISSPCKDTGDNDYVVDATDLDGEVRIYNYIVDMGCYEFVPEPVISVFFGMILLIGSARKPH